MYSKLVEKQFFYHSLKKKTSAFYKRKLQAREKRLIQIPINVTKTFEGVKLNMKTSQKLASYTYNGLLS